MKTARIATFVALAAFACAQDDHQQQSPTGLASHIRDSADIRITENPRPPEGSRLPWRIGPEPTVSIGELEGEEPYMLHEAINFSRLSDGRIVVADYASSEVRMFDASGSHLVSWGGEGEGPGEFLTLTHAAPWPGDSIVAWYTSGLGISVFDSDGNHGRSFVLQSGEEELWRHPRERGSRQLRFPAYGRELVTGQWGDLVVASHTTRYEIRAFRRDGALARIVRREHVPRAPTQEDREAYIEEQLARATSRVPAGILEMEAMEIWRKSLGSTPLAEAFPAFSTILSDTAGNLWVREYDFPREERPAPLWTVFDPEGWVLGFIETPNGLRIGQIGEDYILGHYRDELDIEYVQVWPLERSEG